MRLTRCARRGQVYRKAGKAFPTDPLTPLEMAINAVFDSGECARARQVTPPPHTHTHTLLPSIYSAATEFIPLL